MFTLVVCAILLFTLTDVTQSKNIHQPNVHRWIVEYKIVATWEEAKKNCEVRGGMLASPVDDDLFKYMKSFINVNDHTTAYFTGIRAVRNPDLQFASLEGILIDDMLSATKMIENLDPRDGDCLSMDHRIIRVVPCWTRLPYICYTNTTNTITASNTEDKTIIDCGQGYKKLSTNKCYKAHNYSSTWDSAYSKCEEEGGALAVEPFDYADIKTIAFAENVFPKWIRNLKDTGISILCCSIDKKGIVQSFDCNLKLPFICEK